MRRRPRSEDAILAVAAVHDSQALPGIGPVLAGRIIPARTYRAVEDLDRVPGIGPKRLERIRPLVTAE